MLGEESPSGQVFYFIPSLKHHVLPPLEYMTSGIPGLESQTRRTEFPGIFDFKNKLSHLSTSVCMWGLFVLEGDLKENHLCAL